MDRPDERRDAPVSTDDRTDRDEGVLGIRDANPPRDRVPGRDERASRDERGSTADEDTTRPGSREVRRSPGATGIDMGAGGTGTDIDRDN